MIKLQLRVASILLLAIFLTTCKKVSVPEQEYNKIFGTWNWILSSGGLGGGCFSPTTEGYNQSVEYNKNGRFKKLKNEKVTERKRFEFKENTTRLSGDKYLIVYKDGIIPHNRGDFRHSVEFYGQDTMFLWEDCSDCYQHEYVRRK